MAAERTFAAFLLAMCVPAVVYCGGHVRRSVRWLERYFSVQRFWRGPLPVGPRGPRGVFLEIHRDEWMSGA